MEPLLLAGAIAAGGGLSALALWAAWRYTRPESEAADAPVEMEVVDEPPAPAAARAPSPPAARAIAPARPVMVPPAPGVLPPRGHAAHAPAMVLTQGVHLQDSAPAHVARAPSSRAAPAPLPAPAPSPVSRLPPPSRAPAPRPPMREPPPMKSWAQQVMESTPGEVPTEWARRQVGPVEAGRTTGACGGCGSRLSVSNARPVRIACPVCGRTKLLAS